MKRGMCLAFFLLSLLHYSICQDGDYYIKTSETQSCPDNKECHTLFHYVTHIEDFFTSEVTFVFLQGVHSLNTTAIIKDLNQLDMYVENGSEVNITCSPSVGISFMNISYLTLNGMTFKSCGMEIDPTFFRTAVSTYANTFFNFSVSLNVAVFMNYITDINLIDVGVHNSIGYGMIAVNLLGDAMINGVHFINNNYQTLSIPSCYLEPSLKCKGGGLIVAYTDLQTCPDSSLIYSLRIENSIFRGGVDSGLVYQPFISPIHRDDVQLIGGAGIGLLMMQSSYGVQANITNCTMLYNAAHTGANLYMSVWDFADNSSITITNTSMAHGNIPVSNLDNIEVGYDIATGYFYIYGAIPLSQYTPVCIATEKYEVEVLRIEDCDISYNVATLLVGGFMFLWPRTFLQHTRHIVLNRVQAVGNNGDATLLSFFTGKVQGVTFKTFVTNCTFRDNYYGKQNNFIESNNPEVYLTNSVQFIQFEDCKWINNSASGIRALQSQIYLKGTNEFINNTANNGAGINIRAGSLLVLEPESRTVFENNQAREFGGAIYGVIYSYKCFFQVDRYQTLPRLVFNNNTAGKAGDALYANLEVCIMADYVYSTDSILSFLEISEFSPDQLDSKSVISSPANRLCACEDNEPIDCSGIIVTQRQSFPGNTFTVSIEARGYSAAEFGLDTVINSGLTPTSVTAVIHDNNTPVYLGNLQSTQTIGQGCSDLTYTLYSLEEQTVQILLSPENERLYYPITLNVTLKACPTGFIPSPETLKCECDEILQSNGVTCDINTLSVSRGETQWIGLINQSDTQFIGFGTCTNLVGYCSSSGIAELKLNDPDRQCINSHSGVLCGQCLPGYSITLGSSNCKQCSNNYLSLLIVFAIAGLLLIGFLSLFKVTVSTGRINSMLFYANIIKLANYEFFGLTHPGFVFFQVVINWVNLDFGIESCFYNGFDVYTKAWLQFLFPLYLHVLLWLAIIGAHYSTRIVKILPRNTLSVFTTVNLITFTKLLRASITGLPFTTIKTTEGIYRVWLYDGNIAYLGTKHAPLFFFSLLLFLFYVIPFAVVMLLYPFIWSFTSHEGTMFESFVCFIRKHLFKLKPLLETYDGPYEPNCRYWTGLLMLLRLVIYFFVVSLFGSSNGEIFNSSGVTVISIILLGLVVALKIYKCRVNRIVEFLHLLNLAILQFVLLVLNLSTSEYLGQGITISISIAVAIGIFIASTIYENYFILKQKIYKWLGKEYVDTRKQQCEIISRERDRKMDRVVANDPQTKEDIEFFDVADARNVTSRSSVSFVNENAAKLEQLHEVLMT